MGPFVDVADGFTPQTDIGNPDTDLTGVDEAELLKHNGAGTVDLISGANVWAAITGCDGWYDLTFSGTDTNAEGLLDLVIQDDSDCLPVHKQFMVLAEAAYDSKYVAKDDGFMDVNLKTVGRTDTQETEANNLESACANYSVTRGLTGTAVPAAVADAAGGLAISDGGELDIDAILADTNELQTNQGAWATATGFSTHTAANVKTAIEAGGSSLATILADTNELQTNQGAWATATGFSTHNAAAVKTAIEAGGSSLATILADTNELQTDWADGGRLDLILDAVSGGGANISTAGTNVSTKG